MGISGVSKRLMPPRTVSGEYSRGKVPNVVANSTDVCPPKTPAPVSPPPADQIPQDRNVSEACQQIGVTDNTDDQV
jgi:hypothetical protein